MPTSARSLASGYGARANEYSDARRRFTPLTICFLACLAMAVVGILYVFAAPAVDAAKLAGG